MDIKYFFGTVINVLRKDGVIESGTGTLGEKDNARTKKTVGKEPISG